VFGPAYRVATLWGIPIRVHFTLILALPLMLWDLGALYGALVAVGLFSGIVLHELGHSLVAMRKGCRVREILLLPIGGAARMENLPRRPLDELRMAVAGPLVSLALLLVLVVGGAYLPLRPVIALDHEGVLRLNVVQFIGFANGVLALFNLLPAFPMDGGRVLRALLSPRFGRLRATRIAARTGRFLAVVLGAYALCHIRDRAMLLFIAIFIYWAAGAEYRLVRIQEMWRQAAGWGLAPEDGGDRVIVMPPPYRRGPAQEVPLRPVEGRGWPEDNRFDA
jgi:Zn-dependent protease